MFIWQYYSTIYFFQLQILKLFSYFLLLPFVLHIFVDLYGLIGYIDHLGRKSTVVITTLIMALSCFIVAILPTYAEIGVKAAWIVTMCRIAQGFSSMGETVGAELYLTELIKPPAQYPAVALTSVFTSLGGMGALFVVYLTITTGANWRYAFWIGTGIAMIGGLARTRLRETPEFADAKRRVKNILEKANLDIGKLEENPLWNQKVSIKTSLCRSCMFLFYIRTLWKYFKKFF